MKDKQSLYWKLFTSTLSLSTFTFGGGYVIVPLMEKTFVHDLEWITEEEMLDLVSIAQSSPGSLAINAAILLGFRMAGVAGALLTSLATALPPLVIMTIATYIYSVVQDNPLVNHLLMGMQAGVSAIIITIVFNMGKRIIRQKKVVPIFVMIFSLIAGVIYQVNILWLLFLAAVIGAITTLIEITKNKEDRNTHQEEKKSE